MAHRANGSTSKNFCHRVWVEQNSGSMPGVDSASDTIDFQAELSLHQFLLGREGVLVELNALLPGGPSRGWVLLKGGSGIGKSALLAEWFKWRDCAGPPVPLHPLPHCVAEDWDWSSVVKCSLAAWVEALYPELTALEAWLDPRMTGLLQRESSEVPVPKQQSFVLVVDGLDEVDVEADSANPLPHFLPRVPTLGVRAICASWPTHRHLSWLEALEPERELVTPLGHWAAVTRYAVMPDEQRVVSVSFDEALNVWDIDSGYCLHALYGADPFSSVSSTSDIICTEDQLGTSGFLKWSPRAPG